MTLRPLTRYYPCTYAGCTSRARVSIYSARLRVLVGRGCRYHRGLYEGCVSIWSAPTPTLPGCSALQARAPGERPRAHGSRHARYVGDY